MKRFVLALAAFALLAGGIAFAQTGSPAQLRPPGGLALDSGTKTVTAVAGAATLNKFAGVITTEALVTAAAATYTLTLTNSMIAAADQVFVSSAFGTNTTGSTQVQTVTPAAGSVEIVIRNAHVSAALNGTLKLSFIVIKN
jgi:hypothetical protein